jgi:ribonuclease E
VAEEAAKPKRRNRAKKPVPSEVEGLGASEVEGTSAGDSAVPAEEAATETGSADPVTARDPEPAKPRRTRRKAAEAQPAEEAVPAAPEAAPAAANDANGDQAAAEETGTPRRGWWQRTFGE